MELLAAFSVKAQVETEKIRKILDCVTTEEAVHVLEDSGKLQAIMDTIAERICFYLEKRAKGQLQIDCILYANEFGELAKSKEATKWFTLLEQEQVQ